MNQKLGWLCLWVSVMMWMSIPQALATQRASFQHSVSGVQTTLSHASCLDPGCRLSVFSNLRLLPLV